MTKTIKSFVNTLLISGVAFATTQAGAVPKPSVTNSIVLENISVALKLYTQGLLGGTGKSAPTTLKANIGSFTTADLLKQLQVLTTNAFTYESGDKLVAVLTYTNVLYGTPGTIATDSSSTIVLTNGTNIYLEDTSATNLTFATNQYYLLTNGEVKVGTAPYSPTNLTSYYSSYTNNSVLTSAGTTNYVTVATFPTNYINVGLGYWTTLVPTITNGTTNVTITSYSPTGVYIYTNGGGTVAVLTPKAKTPSDLIPVGAWVSIYGSAAVYNESGKLLSYASGTFAGTNIAAQTGYGIGHLSITAEYLTNTAPTTPSTNIYLSGEGFGSTSTKTSDLTVAGTNKDFFLIPANSSFGVAGTGYIGGTYTTNTLQTNTFNGVTTTNSTYSVDGTLGTNDISARLEAATPVVFDGTVTVTYLSAATNITVITP